MTEEQAISRNIRMFAKRGKIDSICSFLCEVCGDIGFSLTSRNPAGYCSQLCAGRMVGKRARSLTGSMHPNWKGGRTLLKNGYVRLAGYGFNRKTQILEHRAVFEKFLGRELRSNENVHHRNGDRSDNRIENLELWTNPQPTGSRVYDLISWVVDNYENEIRAKLSIKDEVRALIGSGVESR